MGAIERNSFKQVKTNGGYKYYVNGLEVSQAEFNSKRAESKAKIKTVKESAKKGQEDLLGISKENYSKETLEEKKKRLFKEMESFKKGGVVKKKKISSKSITKKYFKGIF
tara:strand:+ start:271 stop:600 length:330 start_codon:yes stop_codon:yes gene_type:complete